MDTKIMNEIGRLRNVTRTIRAAVYSECSFFLDKNIIPLRKIIWFMKRLYQAFYSPNESIFFWSIKR